ncbi:MAG: hypothetical protein ACTMHL_10590 [Janibacter sp.]
MKNEIAASLEGVSPTIADAVRAPDTTVTPVDAAALGDWQVVDVLRRGPHHAQRWFMGVKDSGREVVVLSGFPERWEQVTGGAKVTSAAQAEELARVYADATRDMTVGYARIDSMDDITFLPKPSSSDAQRIDALRRDLADDVKAAKATGDGPWRVRLWTVTDSDLVQHDMEVTSAGSVDDTTRIVESSLPVPRAR